jgi:molybdopterin-containing oxidoreductase family iron-sulfur binding subunit
MEKCTYCVQRIQRARIDARASGSETIPNDSFKTACQAACASGAITFGDLNNADSAVAKSRDGARAYEVLAELNVKPRTSYLARIRNPHPDLTPKRGSSSHSGHGE